MNSFLLLKDIRDTLTASLSDWVMRTETRQQNSREAERYRVPSVSIGQLPPRRGSQPSNVESQGDQETDVPFILVRPIEGLLEGESQADYDINVAIVCGIYSHESREQYEKGVEDVMNLCDHLLITLAGQRFWANNLFLHNQPLKWLIGAPRALGPYEAGLQEVGPIFHMLIETSFSRAFFLPAKPLIK